MQVYQTDLEGVFVGAVIADPSPLEPGVWLIPAGAVQAAPPALEQGQIARWAAGAWVVETRPEPKLDPLPEPDTAAPTSPALSRADFVVSLTQTTPPILTEAEALAALEAFPPKFAAALANKPLAYRAAAVEAWRTTTTVASDAPLFQDLLAHYAAVAKLNAAQAAALGASIFAKASHG